MLRSIELVGFKSFGRKETLVFESPISSIVGPNGSGKSNVAEGFRFVLGEQSMKSMRTKRGEDLIWGGSTSLPRQNRAAVKVTFDNSKKLLDIDFPEVVIERVVHRDGKNEYLINGSNVRLKDVIRLLAGANIGGSGYQIISQGESDRILNTSPRERREMVEDALGLKLYQHKKAESERKLEETEDNIEKVGSLRRELAPHLKFLRRQVEKLERAREMKEELVVQLKDYLARESAWIDSEGARIGDEKSALEEELKSIEDEMRETSSNTKSEDDSSNTEDERRESELEEKLLKIRREREEKVRALGRAEAKLEIREEVGEEIITNEQARAFASEINRELERVEASETIDEARGVITSIKEKIQNFLGGFDNASTNVEGEREVKMLSEELGKIQNEEADLTKQIMQHRAKARKEVETKHEAERELLKLDAKRRELKSNLAALSHKIQEIAYAKRSFEEEVREGIALLGSQGDWQKGEVPEGALIEERNIQEKRRREIERLKIKIEESGAGNSEEIMKEFDETRKRDEFLTREVDDLEKSAASLRSIIEELDNKIDERFKEGLEKINDALREFFQKLFGGGDARLELEKRKQKITEMYDEDSDELIEEKEELVRGLDVHVALPRKKIKGLEVLSGGERALTSIALIFSMSQVNPPPFLILDETDAALDEANSKRYADMVRELGNKSQLVLITHNRATMAAAGELYGVTMGSDGVSKVLSVKLEEAERVAK
jgi:chromosome segregation ATPase